MVVSVTNPQGGDFQPVPSSSPAPIPLGQGFTPSNQLAAIGAPPAISAPSPAPVMGPTAPVGQPSSMMAPSPAYGAPMSYQAGGVNNTGAFMPGPAQIENSGGAPWSVNFEGVNGNPFNSAAFGNGMYARK